ncbi:AAA family ATPase [Haliscomenobacter hydrossis]|uniref:AAA ATPase n=1 Tax=Haliscomenobacter hydrossis (strain ATCC 27775 / DSM 1100 / LMG 10767 / O) TaxID=760192 RepID=F4L0J7_HALH1|nr:AAA family ATPase [Haliscomenobacter hydrossis]AEE48509.1 AAA ATPase [Haliscomenobacter hydrossis DSM 1100]
MEDVFVTELKLKKVRHLENLSISLSKETPKHLILTGKNGSGKTSVLNEIKAFFQQIDGKTITNLKSWKKYRSSLTDKQFYSNYDYSMESNKAFNEIKEIISSNNRSQSGIELIFNAKNFIGPFFHENFIFAFFEAKRLSDFRQPSGPKKLDIKDHYGIDEKANIEFVQHLINLRYNYLEAKESGRQKIANNINQWVEGFEASLKEIFSDESLKLVIDSKNFKYDIITKGREVFDLKTLSDGFSAIINIVTELIMRMEKKHSNVYDAQGLVLIDEIETHLHIDLQKKILPFLTSFFPKIQFIVTTHSPFVLTSLADAIIYDLESQEPIEDLSGYSVEAIIEGYFGSDKYSEALKDKVDEYEQLAKKDELSFSEEKRFKSLKKYFDDLSDVFAEELKLKIQQIRMLKPVK